MARTYHLFELQTPHAWDVSQKLQFANSVMSNEDDSNVILVLYA